MLTAGVSLPRAIQAAQLRRPFAASAILRRSAASQVGRGCSRGGRTSPIYTRGFTVSKGAHRFSASLRSAAAVTRLRPFDTTAPLLARRNSTGTQARRGAFALTCRAMGSMSMAETGTHSASVAVIGAGASGIVAARELKAEGHKVTVLEASQDPGGIWAYDEQIESDLLGSDNSRERVHSSMYASLRTNLPREVMSYLDLPFIPEAMAGRSVDPRRFCSHEEVQAYLRAYVDHYNLHDLIRYGRTVVRARPLWETDSSTMESECVGWEVVHRDSGSGEERTERFEALVVANGHYTQPNLPQPPLPGSDTWPGFQMHSHNYRTPERFAGQVVVVVGAQSSGEDISREIAEVAKEVYVCARNWKDPASAESPVPFGPRSNMWRRHNLAALHPDGSVSFEGGMGVPHAVDTVLYCTGYRYSMPFFEDDKVVSLEGNRVAPLYEHVFASLVAPRLSFIGLPFNVVAFHLFHMQAKWIAQVLSGRSVISPQMEEEVNAFYEAAEVAGLHGRYVHEMRDLQWDYLDRLADYCEDVPRLASWRQPMYKANSMNKRSDVEQYRDVQHDLELQAEAAAEFDCWLSSNCAQGVKEEEVPVQSS